MNGEDGKAVAETIRTPEARMYRLRNIHAMAVQHAGHALGLALEVERLQGIRLRSVEVEGSLVNVRLSLAGRPEVTPLNLSPGEWLVIEGSKVTRMTDAAFKNKYEEIGHGR